MPQPTPNALLRLRKHADYQRVYTASRKQFSKQISFFFSLRPPDRRSDTPGPRIGLTVGKVLGKAVDRNRIKRRLRECVRHHARTLTGPVDVILHPRRTVLDLDHATLNREVAQIFRTIQTLLNKGVPPHHRGQAQTAQGNRGVSLSNQPAPSPTTPIDPLKPLPPQLLPSQPLPTKP